MNQDPLAVFEMIGHGGRGFVGTSGDDRLFINASCGRGQFKRP
ncbi:hypothetical protein [Cohnella sp. GCM10012308]